MENVRVKRAGFVFRQEYDVALERYKFKGFLLDSPALVSDTNLGHFAKT